MSHGMPQKPAVHGRSIIVIPSRILDKMDPKDRPEGPAGWTAAESQARGARKQEIPEQKTFATELDRREILYLRPRSDKKSTIRKGAPDFTVFIPLGKVIFLEFKAPGAKQTPDQIEFMNAARKAGYRYEVAYSALEAIQILKEEILKAVAASLMLSGD